MSSESSHVNLAGELELLANQASDMDEELKQRIVHVGDPARSSDSQGLARNSIRTNKYRWYTFIPKNLFEQFRRLAYVFAFAIALLNQIPVLAVFGRAASMVPLGSVLFITALKDGYEDWCRYRSDVAENNREALVYHQETQDYQPKKWKDVQVGDVVQVCAEETIPCDMVLLKSSDPSGLAYVETINLDGESNLKSRYAHNIQESASQRPDMNPVNGVLHCEHPHKDIYQFRGNLELQDLQQLLPLGPNNMILRGCQLKNTEWVIGVVVYAGQQTKVMLNSSGAPSKRSKLEQKMNRETLWFVVLLFVMCLVAGVGTLVWLKDHQKVLDKLPYYKRKDFSGNNYLYSGMFGEAVVAFLLVIISSQSIIPLVLYISLEFVRLGQSYFMNRDREMFHEETNTGFQCRALNINEDLGQIDYVFSDKTGTLTENIMVFHTASIYGVKYPMRKQDEDPDVSNLDEELDHMLESPNEKKLAMLADYFLVLAACNTVVPALTKKLDTTGAATTTLEYQAESPDERALVLAAASYGFKLVERTASTIVIDIKGNPQRYKVLGIHEFDSVRKRMSVVVECPDKSIKVLVKGADSHMLGIVNSDPDEVLELTESHLSDFSWDGLRTLVLAAKKLNKTEFEEWRRMYNSATGALAERSNKIEAAAGVVEKQLTLLGATGIEDKLQEGVPDTITSLREAGIKVWLLTGDKQETAISIGFSSELLTHDMEQLLINSQNSEGCSEALSASKARQLQELHSSFALIIDGTSLAHALSPDTEQEFFDVAVRCQVVLCCRLAPYQKACIVKLIRSKGNVTTLAIGDGANDVAMIQAADIGVGICGQEGRQAVMAADYAMAQFRFLKRLLLVHGHWNHRRLCYIVLYIFYRTATFVMMEFWYVFYCAYSSQPPMFDWNGILYNLYVSVPSLVVGIMDQFVSDKTLLKHPALYGSGRRNEYYNQKLFWITMLDTLWQSLTLFYVPFFTIGNSGVDIWSLGSFWIVAAVVIVLLDLAMDVHTWTWILHLILWGSIVFTIFCQLIFSSITSESFLTQYGVFYRVFGTANFWLDMMLVIVLGLLPRFVVKMFMHRFFPSDVQIAREAQLLRRSPSSNLATRLICQAQ